MSTLPPYSESYFRSGRVVKVRHVFKARRGAATPYLSVNASVLDVGCASGTLLEELRERGHKALAGVDVSEYAVRASKENGFENVYLCNFQDGTQLPDSSYDTLFMLDVIEHFTRPYDALIEATRVLSPGGVLVLTTPNANSILRPLLGKRWALGDETHVFYFTPFSLKNLLGKCGLHVAK